LVWGEEVSRDATNVETNSAMGSLRPRFGAEAHLAHLFAQPDDGDGKDRNGDPEGDEPMRLRRDRLS
jgi:hypothetical protein